MSFDLRATAAVISVKSNGSRLAGSRLARSFFLRLLLLLRRHLDPCKQEKQSIEQKRENGHGLTGLLCDFQN